MHTLEVCHVCALLTLIRAAEGLTLRGRLPLHSRDGHSQPVNPPCCMRPPQKAAECGALTKRWRRHSDFKSQTCRHAQKDRQTTPPTHTHILVSHFHPVLLPPCSGTAAGLSDCQSHWWIYSAVSKYCPPTFLCLSLLILSQVKILYRHLMFSLLYYSMFRTQLSHMKGKGEILMKKTKHCTLECFCFTTNSKP